MSNEINFNIYYVLKKMRMKIICSVNLLAKCALSKMIFALLLPKILSLKLTTLKFD